MKAEGDRVNHRYHANSSSAIRKAVQWPARISRRISFLIRISLTVASAQIQQLRSQSPCTHYF